MKTESESLGGLSSEQKDLADKRIKDLEKQIERIENMTPEEKERERKNTDDSNRGEPAYHGVYTTTPVIFPHCVDFIVSQAVCNATRVSRCVEHSSSQFQQGSIQLVRFKSEQYGGILTLFENTTKDFTFELNQLYV